MPPYDSQWEEARRQLAVDDSPPKNLIFGVGYGIALLVMVPVIGLVTCWIGNKTKSSRNVCCTSCIVCSLIIGFLLLAPKGAVSGAADGATDQNFATRNGVRLLVLAGVALGAGSFFKDYVIENRSLKKKIGGRA